MEFLSKTATAITTAILFTITVIIVSGAIIFFILSIEVKLLISKRRKILDQLTREEQRLLELSLLVGKAMASVNDYILELSHKRLALQNRKENCILILQNSIDTRIKE